MFVLHTNHVWQNFGDGHGHVLSPGNENNFEVSPLKVEERERGGDTPDVALCRMSGGGLAFPRGRKWKA